MRIFCYTTHSERVQDVEGVTTDSIQLASIHVKIVPDTSLGEGAFCRSLTRELRKR